MIVHNITESNDFGFTPVGNDHTLWALQDDVTIDVYTDIGRFEFSAKAGIVVDGRSGPNWINWILPRYGTKPYLYSHTTHDWCFTYRLLSFELSNELFDAILKYAKIGKIKRWLARKAVGSAYARWLYNTDDDLNPDKSLCTVRWYDK